MGEYSGTGILFSTSELHDTPRWSWPRGPLPGSLRPPSCCMCHHHSEWRCPGATDRQDSGPRTLPLPVHPRNLQTHVQKIFHRSDVKAQTFQPCGPSCVL